VVLSRVAACLWHGEAPAGRGLAKPAEPEVVTTLKRACKKLSDRKQREIVAFIELVAAPQKRPRKIPEGVVEWRSI
jgi:cytochrome c1